MNKPTFREPAPFSLARSCVLTKRTDIFAQIVVYSLLKQRTRLEACEGFTGLIRNIPKLSIQLISESIKIKYVRMVTLISRSNLLSVPKCTYMFTT